MARSRSLESFDGVVGSVTARLMASINLDMERAALAMLQPRRGERFLVIGFGPGAGLVALLDLVSPASVLAADPSAAMVRSAHRRLADHPAGASVELLEIPASQVHSERPLDAALSVNSQQLWDPHRDSLQAVAETLRPGGRIITLTHEWAIEKHHTLSGWKATVEADLSATGFSAPLWTHGCYRSGRGIGMQARRVN